MRHLSPAYRSAISPKLSREFARWVQEHDERGCGAPIGGCRCDCDDHGCANLYPTPDCGTCGDSGLVAGPRDRDAAGFGKAQPCPSCQPEADRRHFAYERQLTGLAPDEIDEHPLGALDAGSLPRIGAEAWEAFSYRPPTLVLAGPTGTGKTHAAIGLLRGLLDGGRHCYFSTASELLQSVRDTFDRSDNRSLDDVMRMPLAVGVLVLDDLGAEKQTEWAHEQVFRIVNHRYSRGLITIVTTNLTPQSAPRDRLWSRLFGDRFAQIIVTHGADRRREA